MIHAIDPGKKKSAIAVFENGRLAGVMTSSVGVPLQAKLCVIEKPRVYTQATEKDPNDLIDLAIAVGRLARDYERHSIPVRFVEPREWKGTVKKPQSHARIWAKLDDAERGVIARALGLPASVIEKKIKDACEKLARHGRVSGYRWDAHNTLDAIGIGLKELKR